MSKFMVEIDGELLERPDILPKVVPIYERENSLYPDAVRVSFANGRTIEYDIFEEQPAPQIQASIEIIQKWNTGYQYQQPKRRRCRK